MNGGKGGLPYQMNEQKLDVSYLVRQNSISKVGKRIRRFRFIYNFNNLRNIIIKGTVFDKK